MKNKKIFCSKKITLIIYFFKYIDFFLLKINEFKKEKLKNLFYFILLLKIKINKLNINFINTHFKKNKILIFHLFYKHRIILFLQKGH